ncbi:MAG: hypothetical protein AAFV46_14265 [Cyanobacteria bacterium J06635_11]
MIYFITAFVADLLDAQCRNTSFLQSDRDVFKVVPVTTVIRPWLGRHHVYGVFRLPNKHVLTYPALLTINGIGRYRREASMIRRWRRKAHSVLLDECLASDYSAREYLAGHYLAGHYLVRVHLRTRLALFVLFRGLHGRLQNPKNWALTYTVSKRSKT